MNGRLKRIMRATRALFGGRPRGVERKLHANESVRANAAKVDEGSGSLHATLDALDEGIALLDGEFRVRFINRALQHLIDVEQRSPEQSPALEDLLREVCGARAALPEDLDRRVNECMASVLGGDGKPFKLCLDDGEVIEQKCSVLPDRSRLLVYRTVTHRVRQQEEIEGLRAALSEVEHGVVLLDGKLRVRFINRAFRRMADLLDEFVDSMPSYVEILEHGRRTSAFDMQPEEIDRYIRDRLKMVREGLSAPIEIRWSRGRVVRAQIAPLPDGGRMLTYTDITEHETIAPELVPR